MMWPRPLRPSRSHWETTIARKLGGALLALLVLSLVVFVSCGVPESEPELPALDEAAVRACEVYAPAAGSVVDGSLTGPPLFRRLQDTFNAARTSQTPGFSEQVRLLYGAAVAGDRAAVEAQAGALQQRCAQPQGG